MSQQTKVTGVILAGGLARRMNNQDKGLMLFNGQPLVSYAISAMQPVADQIVINANRNLDVYRQFAIPVISDQTANFDGPLAGILAGMWYAQSGELLVMPCDSPFFSVEYLQQLLSAKRKNHANIAVAWDGERLHPVFLALNVNLSADLADYLASGGRKVETWLNRHQLAAVDFSKSREIFRNINTLDELSGFENLK